MTPVQRDAVRMALSGQIEEPVSLETGTQDEEQPPAPAQEGPGGLEVTAEQVSAQLQAHDPILWELMVSRAALRMLLPS